MIDALRVFDFSPIKYREISRKNEPRFTLDSDVKAFDKYVVVKLANSRQRVLVTNIVYRTRAATVVICDCN